MQLSAVAQLADWFECPLGQIILNSEQQIANQWLRSCYGYHALQIGLIDQNYWIANSLIKHKIALSPAPRLSDFSRIIGDFQALPFKDESIDLVCLPHILELCDDPGLVLAEATRVLVPGGKLLIFGFNASGWWRYWPLLTAFTAKKPPLARMLCKMKLLQLLNLYLFVPIDIQNNCYRLPLQSQKWLEKTHVLEQIGQKCWPGLGLIYACCFDKRTFPLTPIKKKWQYQKPVLREVSANEVSQIEHKL